ncbi:MAG TPA: alpha/beta hydrolase [Dehalococcoidia bacterium]|nr:alpha/beta hydrolase [Dehalococcoidia bacterium]
MSKIALDESSGLYVDAESGRKFFLDEPDDLKADEKVTFLLNLHGGGSHGIWQHLYFPAQDYKNEYRLVVATPTSKTKEPMRRWVDEADDQWLRDIVEFVCDKYGKDRIKSFWLVGHSQGGMTSNRLLQSDYFASRVDGWLSLSGGRIGPAEIAPSFFEGSDRPMPAFAPDGPRPGRAVIPDCDISFIFSTGGLEIVKLPETSPWAEKYNAGHRVRLPDVVDTEKGQVTGETPGRGPSWGRAARPGTAEVYVYPNASGGRVIADVVRLDKGHTEGYEPKITEELIKMVVGAPGGKWMALAQAG